MPFAFTANKAPQKGAFISLQSCSGLTQTSNRRRHAERVTRISLLDSRVKHGNDRGEKKHGNDKLWPA